MGYEAIYGEEWTGEKIVGYIHLHISGTTEERKGLARKLERAMGTTLESLATEMLDDGTYYKIPAKDMWNQGTPIERLASIVGVRHLTDNELRELVSDTYGLDSIRAHNELAIRRREAGHMVNQWSPKR